MPFTRAIHGARPSGQLRCSLRHPAFAVKAFRKHVPLDRLSYSGVTANYRGAFARC